MTRSRNHRPPARRLHPAAAFGMLGLCAAYAASSLTGAFRITSSGGSAAEAPPLEIGVRAEDHRAVRVDLLAVHGSHERGADVRLAFAAADGLLPAPLGETANGTGARRGEPPTLRLGVVLVGAGSRRAVVDGTVVGVGDTVKGATVVAIDPGRLTVRFGARQWTYDLDDVRPRELRTGAAPRRAAAGTDSPENDR